MATFQINQEGPVNALALNKDFSQVAIGGRNGNSKIKFIFRFLQFFV